ncbi:hypothetical protein SNE40_016969 [Patella caerulea]|uniref:G-protein coupled receptors family 1 profile domain-containing protein n=1 Tax=Patella caerulea TaxID=87958 RepID=A0AAN8JE38_PATCE
MAANYTEESSSRTQIIANGILGLCTLLLNVISLVSILQSRSFPIRQKVVFFSLLATDTILGIQTTAVRLLPLRYTTEHILCQLRLFSGTIITLATILSNLLITTERLLAMILPMNLNKKITWKKLAALAIFLWILSGTLTFSFFSDGYHGPVCQFIVTGNPNGYVFIGSFIIVIFFIIFVMYSYIVKVTRRHIRQIAATMVGNTPVIDERRAFKSKAELRTTVTVGIIVGVFGMSYCPMAVYLIYCGLFVSDMFAFTATNQTVFTIMVTFYMMNSVINPIIYILRLKNCRQEMIARILCRPQPHFENPKP